MYMQSSSKWEEEGGNSSYRNGQERGSYQFLEEQNSSVLSHDTEFGGEIQRLNIDFFFFNFFLHQSHEAK